MLLRVNAGRPDEGNSTADVDRGTTKSLCLYLGFTRPVSHRTDSTPRIVGASQARHAEVPRRRYAATWAFSPRFGDLLGQPVEADVAVRLDSLLLAGKSSGQRTGFPVIVCPSTVMVTVTE